MRMRIYITALLAMLTLCSMAQKVTIKGRVTDVVQKPNFLVTPPPTPSVLSLRNRGAYPHRYSRRWGITL